MSKKADDVAYANTIVKQGEMLAVVINTGCHTKFRIVGTTGDGVKDAPALKKADCGIAVSNATDAARAAADIVLTSPGLGVINEAVKQARITFERMKSYALFRIAETIRIILFNDAVKLWTQRLLGVGSAAPATLAA